MTDGIKGYQQKCGEVMSTEYQTADYQQEFSNTNLQESGI
jgi:hypothetical protein